MEQTLTYTYYELLELIPHSHHDELKEISNIVYNERRLYAEITMSRIAKLIAKRLRELGPPVSDKKMPF